jgi:GNAT superfamily N-acetyltransferase
VTVRSLRSVNAVVAPEDDLTAAIAANFLAWIPLFEHLPGATVERLHGCVRWTSPSPLPFLNGVAGWPDRDEGAAVDEILAPFDAGSIPLLWVAMPGQDAAPTLGARGFGIGSPPGMAMDLAGLPRSEPLPRVAIRTVDGDATALRDAFGIALVTNGLPAEATEPVCAAYGAFAGNDGVRTYLATVEGEPAAASTLWCAAGVAGLYNVGTLPAYRGRGLGRAVSIAALADGRALGYRVGVLQASDLGRPVYARIGFQERCRFTFAVRMKLKEE